MEVEHLRRRYRKAEFMWVLFLEAGVALGLLVFIIWWVTRKPKTPPKDAPPQ
jgi:hypothetical protein